MKSDSDKETEQVDALASIALAQMLATESPAEAKQSEPRRLVCSCCGGETHGRQWHNRDIGYGLCNDCAARIRPKETPEQFRRCYGVFGYHYGLPVFAIGDKVRGLAYVDCFGVSHAPIDGLTVTAVHVVDCRCAAHIRVTASNSKGYTIIEGAERYFEKQD